ncbi:MAG: hypothetical protein AABX79_03010 [Nanoarchaeota archaeon]
MSEKEVLEHLLRSTLFGIFAGSLVSNLHFYFSISSQLHNNLLERGIEGMRDSEEFAKSSLEYTEKRSFVIRHLFYTGTRLACKKFLREIGEDH